jgi:hypothetical protein
MQADFGSNINVVVPAAFTDAVLKDLSVLSTDGKYYADIMAQLADGDDGFDWYINVTKDGTTYRKDLLIGYPQLGTNPFEGMVVFEYPGNITQYYFTEVMIDAGTNIFAIGEGEGSTAIIGTFEDTALITTGEVRWDVDAPHKSVNDQAAIDSLAAQEGIIRRPPMPVIKMTVKANLEPVFGSYGLGDTCGIVIQDARFPPPGVDLHKRLLKWELTPQSSDATEEASLIFDGDPDV